MCQKRNHTMRNSWSSSFIPFWGLKEKGCQKNTMYRYLGQIDLIKKGLVRARSNQMLHVGLQFHLINQATSAPEKVHSTLIWLVTLKINPMQQQQKIKALSNKCHHESLWAPDHGWDASPTSQKSLWRPQLSQGPSHYTLSSFYRGIFRDSPAQSLP